MMKRIFVPILLCLVLGQVLVACSQINYRLRNGYVPDAKTAIRIAVATWSPIYGEKQIVGEKPYHAVLSRGVWKVTGSLPTFVGADGKREVVTGGVALAEIAQKDGRILRIIHGK